MTPAFVLALAQLLHPHSAPTRAELAFARAVAAVASVDAPMPGMTREATAALLVTTGFEESRFRNDVRGDHGFAVCSMQVHARGAEARRLERSLVACVRRGLEIMRASARACPSAPLGGYCGGCSRPAARRISARRLALAAALLSGARK